MIDDYDECSGWMFLLVPAHPGCPGQFPQSRKTVVCVCVCVSSCNVDLLNTNTCIPHLCSSTHWAWLSNLVNTQCKRHRCQWSCSAVLVAKLFWSSTCWTTQMPQSPKFRTAMIPCWLDLLL